jgi:hypothetical protein
MAKKEVDERVKISQSGGIALYKKLGKKAWSEKSRAAVNARWEKVRKAKALAEKKARADARK